LKSEAEIFLDRPISKGIRKKIGRAKSFERRKRKFGERIKWRKREKGKSGRRVKQ
jgi:hypothetical protein